MTGTRPHVDHPSRLDWWRRQIQRQAKTKLTIADFCRQLGVSVPTFHYWKRRVQAGPRTPSGSVTAPSQSRLPAPAAAPFVPVSIVNPDADTHLEIELANACVVRFRGAISPRLLRAAITAVGSLGGSRQGAP
jgi:transposase-like protein